MSKHVAPEFDKSSFTCPYCGVLTSQKWESFYLPHASISSLGQPMYYISEEVQRVRCFDCDEYSYWLHERMIWPDFGTAPPYHDELPDDLKPLYLEAAAISARSPRAAAALLRLLVEKYVASMAMDRGVKGKDLNDDIGNLVAAGVPAAVADALDTVRVLGNESVHPGEIDLNEDPAIVGALFAVINFIVEESVAQPKRRQALQDLIPVSKRQGIEARNRRKLGGTSD